MENIINKSIDGDYILLSTAYEKVEYKNKWLICTLKNDYIKSQKTERHEIAIASIFIDPLFWQALGKACGCENVGWGGYGDWTGVAIRFHEINFTENWDSAVKYLENLIKE